MKLGMVDYVRDPTPHDNFGGGSTTWVVWANVCNTNSRILEKSEKFIFFGILVLVMHPARRPLTSDLAYACGVWTYKLPLWPTTPEAVYTSHKTATELDIKLAPDY